MARGRSPARFKSTAAPRPTAAIKALEDDHDFVTVIGLTTAFGRAVAVSTAFELFPAGLTGVIDLVPIASAIWSKWGSAFAAGQYPVGGAYAKAIARSVVLGFIIAVLPQLRPLVDVSAFVPWLELLQAFYLVEALATGGEWRSTTDPAVWLTAAVVIGLESRLSGGVAALPSKYVPSNFLDVNNVRTHVAAVLSSASLFLALLRALKAAGTSAATSANSTLLAVVLGHAMWAALFGPAISVLAPDVHSKAAVALVESWIAPYLLVQST